MGIPESFSRLCRSYIDLADRFQQLDVECMGLKKRLVSLLRSIKAKDEKIDALAAENRRLTEALEATTAKYDALKSWEAVMGDNLKALMAQAEEQADLVDETLQEMDSDGVPGLSAEDRQILEQFYADPQQFTGREANGHQPVLELATSSEPVKETA